MEKRYPKNAQLLIMDFCKNQHTRMVRDIL
jgi:hypothetical protein